MSKLREQIVEYFSGYYKFVDEYDCADYFMDQHKREEVLREIENMLNEKVLKRDDNFNCFVEIT
jgi:hypothetical protein